MSDYPLDPWMTPSPDAAQPETASSNPDAAPQPTPGGAPADPITLPASALVPPSTPSQPPMPTPPAPNSHNPRRRTRRGWLAASGVALAALALLGGGAALAFAHNQSMQASVLPHPTTTAPAHSAHATARTFTVTAIQGSVITVKRNDGTVMTIHTTSKTKILRAGQPATLADIVVGSTLHISGNAKGDGSVTARRIEIVLASVVGAVTAINGTTITVHAHDGVQTIVVTPQTIYVTHHTHTPTTFSALTIGAHIRVEGAPTSGGAFSAIRIEITGPTASPTPTTPGVSTPAA